MTTVKITTTPRLIPGTNFLARYPLFGFFTLAITITWVIARPSLLFALPFEPFQTAGHTVLSSPR